LPRQSPNHASWVPTVGGDLLSYVNLLRFIKDFARAHEISNYSYFEFGVLNGESVIESIRQLRGGLSKVFVFDTFAGIPKLEDSDLDPKELAPAFTEGNFKGLSLNAVKEIILRSTDFDANNLFLVEGDFRKSLKEYKVDTKTNFPLVFHVDCDIYSSSKVVLEWVAQNAGDGSWLLCDDYWTYRGHPNMGQRRAVSEVFTNHPRVHLSRYSNYKGFSSAFIINLK
jgi:hypothetical protein